MSCMVSAQLHSNSFLICIPTRYPGKELEIGNIETDYKDIFMICVVWLFGGILPIIWKIVLFYSVLMYFPFGHIVLQYYTCPMSPNHAPSILNIWSLFCLQKYVH
uniref:Uncharacterized protein n=1 Tax=Cacopsylla melanoneura TaxID=428564 RepID=A0A8D8ZER9_9HEMI